uniref:TIGR01777 family oxidoreductase n=1 Tax=Ningiella ruwaisensis TaxID=2364274 RepID=UPI00109F7F8C|nr:TIGR01777 family oxidoreductase [Ningiella ruwaisensis]
MKHILLTGGTGLIGRHLIEKLKSKYQFSVISRDPKRAKRLLGDDIQAMEIEDLSNLENIDIVVNLAGEPIADSRWSDSQKQRICASRWDITSRLVELINKSESKPETFISGSAIGFYGRQGDTPITEDFNDFHEEFSREVCKKWEDIANQAQTRTCILRTGVVLSDDGGALSKMLMPFRLGLGGPIGDGKQFMSWIHIDDMVRGIQFLIENEQCSGPFNFTSPKPASNAFFAHKLCKRLDRPCIFTTPTFAVKLLMGESSELVIYGQKVIPMRLEAAGFHFNYPVLMDALDSLDLR